MKLSTITLGFVIVLALLLSTARLARCQMSTYQQQQLYLQQQQNLLQQQQLNEMQMQRHNQQLRDLGPLPTLQPAHPMQSFINGFQAGQRMGR